MKFAVVLIVGIFVGAVGAYGALRVQNLEHELARASEQVSAFRIAATQCEETMKAWEPPGPAPLIAGENPLAYLD